ncbi:MAG: glycoside hydrolase family 99-like domain-containing protein [Fibromonadaceae bacterium]|jgi:hypothetical protein|nr:glycoside hydrolase family 99-like domain-containing protein [Fibromonadaceae bacterium]
MEQLNAPKKVKILAYFLPQFHAIPENDMWWGEGFTEWTNVKKENRLSENLQPLNDNYYNLLEEETVLWQTKLAKQYGVYGFVYYHYYFCGKKLLEKPAENLLKNKSIKQKFCFCWANHSWNRSWHGSRELLQEQKYGNEAEWSEHFDYLLPFFRDERYIKVNNKPLFVVYDGNFKEKEAIYKLFNKNARKNGFDGVFFTESLYNTEQVKYISNNLEAVTIREPFFSRILYQHNSFIRCINKINRIRNKIRYSLLKIFKFKFLLLKYNGNKMIKRIVRNSRDLCKDMRSKGVKCWLGAFSNWDNTSRHGFRGYKITSISDKNYIWYLTELKKIAEQEDMEYIFFNAWNEWAEGMILEPDTRNGYRFLEGIKKVFGSDNFTEVV